MPNSRPWLDLPLPRLREAASPLVRRRSSGKDHAPPPLLRLAADATLLYPLLVVLCLYGEWLLAWSVLGHPPLPSLNDPKLLAGSSRLHGLTGVVLIGALPALCASVVFYPIVGILPRPSPRRIALRALAVVASWGALFALLRWDPGRVLEWWLD